MDKLNYLIAEIEDTGHMSKLNCTYQSCANYDQYSHPHLDRHIVALLLSEIAGQKNHQKE